jgi:Protein of unknown function (DUF3224)
MVKTTRATGTFKVSSWDEGPYAEHEGAPKLTLARVIASYSGDLEGQGTAHSLMLYADGARYFGFERVVGSVGGRPGSFVLRSEGTWQDGAARTTWSVVPGSGTGELSGLRGEGAYTAGDEGEVHYTLDYHFE